MIPELDETIRQLLIAELPVKKGEIDISFEQPKREWSAKVSRPTINLFLYDVRENVVLRAHQWEKVPIVNLADRQSHLKRTPFRVDCYYMITTWAMDPEDEHSLLSRCMMALFRFPVLPEDRLVDDLKKQPFEVQARLAEDDKLTNPADVWAAMDNEMRPSIPYIVTLALDPWTEVTGPLVRTRLLRTGQTIKPRRENLQEQSAELFTIGGTVWDSPQMKNVQSEVQVAVKGTGYVATTDAEGHFRLGGLPRGEYTLLAWPAEGKPSEKKIAVPAGAGADYDLVLGTERA